MAFIKAFTGSLGGTFADQWLDFLTVPDGLPGTVGVCKATRSSSNSNRSSNTKGSDCVITEGSLILVPEGYALITLENGSVTGYVDEPGGYTWTSDNINSKSFFAGGSVKESVLKQAWNRFTFGGTPGASQIAVYVNLKEIPNNKFGTQSEVYWDDAYLNAQVGATARGTYSLQITDPVLFLKGFVPAAYYSFNTSVCVFDFADFGNDAATQVFNEVVASLAASFSVYANADASGSRISRLQGDAVGFAQALAKVVDDNFQWRSDRGLQIVKAALISIDYDSATKELLAKVQRADALMGSRGNSNLQASFAEGIQSAGSNPDGGAMGIAFMNMAMNGSAGMAAMQQPTSPSRLQQVEDPYEKLEKMKGLLDKGIISQEEFDVAKKKTLGL